MKKKRKKKKAVKKDPIRFQIPEKAIGPLIITASILSFFGMLSFAWGPEASYSLGLLGYAIGWLYTALFGILAYFIIAYLFWVGWVRFFNQNKEFKRQKHLYFALLILSISVLFSLLEETLPLLANGVRHLFFTRAYEKKLSFHLGGAPLYYLYRDFPTLNFSRTINHLGVFFIFGSLGAFSFFRFFEIPPIDLKSWIPKRKLKSIEPQRFVKYRTPDVKFDEPLEIEPEKKLVVRPTLMQKEIKQPPPPPPPPPPPATKREQALVAQAIVNGDFSGYKMPTGTLLTSPKKVDQSLIRKDLKKRAEVLEETLMSFGIEAKVGEINCGPTITSFEVHPAIGVKVQKVKALESDIALNMEAKSLRILAPIPGKAAIGIEVPNPHPQEVSFKEMLSTYQNSNRNFHIPLLLGKTVSGESVMSDLTKMPHMIIAGATGSGKSVCINTIVMSIVMNTKPDEIKMIMVDPKKVELTPYTALPHMLAPVITEPQGASAAMHWLVKEMESRYELLKLVGLRNIASFNNRKINQEFEASLKREVPKKLHYIVAIVDELADLMMVSSNDIETYIARIAQMARAVGIHLILATQRPSREVITGLIKANFPTRISFKVASRVNSQIVLDETGAESLLGNGDMLFLPPGSSHLVRAQGAFIRDEDINRVISEITAQAPPNYVIESFDRMDAPGSLKEDGTYTPQDPLYDQALEVILSTHNASTTFLQRKLKIGYARAASLIDELESQGVVGPADGAKPRKILIAEEV